MNTPRRLVTLAVLLLAAACGGDPATSTTTSTTLVVSTTVAPTTPTTGVIPPPAPTGSLLVWADPMVADAARGRGAAFTADTGVEVVVVPIAPDDILATVLDGGVDLPDVFIGPHVWLYRLARAGLTEPVTLADGLPSAVVDAVSLRGFTLGVPLAVDALVQLRNPSLVATRPVSVESIACAGCFVLPGDLDVTYPFLATLGGYVFAPDPDIGYVVTDTTVDSEEAIAAAGVLQALVAAGAVDPAADRAAALARFTAGTAGIIWAGPEAIGLIPGEAVEAIPTIGDAPAVSPVRVMTAFVNGRGSHKSEAAAFAESYLGDRHGSRAFADSLGMAPVWEAAATAAESVVIAAADTGHAVPYAPETDDAWDELSDAFARILLGTDAATALIDAGDAIRFGHYEEGDAAG